MKIWMNVTDAAEYAGVCKDTIYTAAERGELRHVRIGGRRAIRVKREWIDEWFERHTRLTLVARPAAGQGAQARSNEA